MFRKIEPGRNEAIAEQFLSGKPAKAIAADFGLTQNAIYTILKRMGVSVKEFNKAEMQRLRMNACDYYEENKGYGKSRAIAAHLGISLSTMSKWKYIIKKNNQQ